MCKKLFVAALAVVAGLFILNSTHLGGYARTAWHKAKQAVKRNIPVEVQLEALRNEAAQLVPDMRAQVNALAVKTVAVERLRDDIRHIQANLDQRAQALRVMKEDLKRETKQINYEGVNYPREVIRNKLVHDLASFKRCAAELEAKKKLLQAEDETLANAREQLDSMRYAKEQVEIEIAQLEAELKSVQLAETRSHFALDDSRLSDIKRRLAGIHDQLKVRKMEGELWVNFQDGTGIKVEKRKSDNEVIQEAEAALGENGPQVAGK